MDGATVRYRTIVADPPWAYPEGWPVGAEGAQAWRRANRLGAVCDLRRRTEQQYPALSVAEIAAINVAELAAQSCHLYLWTTNRYLHDAFHVLEAWGFRYGQTLVWAKTPMGMAPGGTWAQTVEYVLTARRGSQRNRRRFDSCWFNWPRMGKAHSRKPEAFLDMVEQTSPGPYLELFARRNRLGWDTWGNEALNHVELGSVMSDA